MIKEEAFGRDQTDLALDFERVRRHGKAEQLDGSRGGRGETHQHADGGGFARAVGSEKAEEAAAWDSESEAIHGGFGSVDFTQIADRDGWSEVHGEASWYLAPPGGLRERGNIRVNRPA